MTLQSETQAVWLESKYLLGTVFIHLVQAVELVQVSQEGIDT